VKFVSACGAIGPKCMFYWAQQSSRYVIFRIMMAVITRDQNTQISRDYSAIYWPTGKHLSVPLRLLWLQSPLTLRTDSDFCHQGRSGHRNCPKYLRFSKHTLMTIHLKDLEEHFLMVPLFIIFYIQRRSTALLILGCYWPCRNPCLFEVAFTHSNVCEILIHVNRQERFFPRTSARRRIAPEDQIFIIISPLLSDNPHTYINVHPSGIKNINDNLVFQRAEYPISLGHWMRQTEWKWTEVSGCYSWDTFEVKMHFLYFSKKNLSSKGVMKVMNCWFSPPPTQCINIVIYLQ
jgi:hypothetical protein